MLGQCEAFINYEKLQKAANYSLRCEAASKRSIKATKKQPASTSIKAAK